MITICSGVFIIGFVGLYLLFVFAVHGEGILRKRSRAGKREEYLYNC